MLPLISTFRNHLSTFVLAETTRCKGAWEQTFYKDVQSVTSADNLRNSDALQYYEDYLAPFDDNVFAPNAWGPVKKSHEHNIVSLCPVRENCSYILLL